MYRVRVLLGAALTVGALAVPSTTAQAQTVVGCGEQQLKEALTRANADSEGGTLVLTPGCTYTITKDEDSDGTGLPVITRAVSITGLGNVIRRDPAAPDFRLFEVEGERGSLALTAVTVQGGRAPDIGGGILVHSNGSLAITAGSVQDNSAVGTGGGIENDNGKVVLTATRLSGNSAHAGGGLNIRGATKNDAGGSAVLDDLTQVTGNTANYSGGGIRSKGALSLTHTTVEGNKAANAGGIDVRGGEGSTATLKNSSVRKNTAGSATSDGARGGGIRSAGTLTLDDSLIEDNQALGPNAKGAGLANMAPLPTVATLNDSKVSSNTATTSPGGIYNEADVGLVFSTVVTNQPSDCAGSPALVPGCTG
ncbi:hypothetical protein [Streptomyces sp. NPDC003635]